MVDKHITERGRAKKTTTRGEKGGTGGYREGTRQPAGAFWISALAPSFMLGATVRPSKSGAGMKQDPRQGLDFHATLAPRSAASGGRFQCSNSTFNGRRCRLLFQRFPSCILLSTQRSSIRFFSSSVAEEKVRFILPTVPQRPCWSSARRL